MLPIITCLVNQSLAEGVFPDDFKQAIVKPLLKKPSLDKKCLKNYRPVSNLSFISKIIEKVVAKRIEDHISSNTLHDNLQSAYRAAHSTETVHHDISVSLDKGCCAVLLMLDLSAAFDVIDHDILFRRLEYSYGIAGSALRWLHSYLGDRSQRVSIDSTLSEPKFFRIGLPQGLVLGPKIYCMYAKPIGEICHRNNMNYHCYADDTQIYIMVEPRDNWNDISNRLTTCLNDIQNWMNANLLKLNQEKRN